jgi:hypothetical protein
MDMGFLDKAKEAAQKAAATAQQQVSTMQQQSAANKASGISTGSRDALLRDLGAAYLALKKGDGSQEAVDAALAAVEAHDTQFANMGSLDDLNTPAGSAPSAPPQNGASPEAPSAGTPAASRAGTSLLADLLHEVCADARFWNNCEVSVSCGLLARS